MITSSATTYSIANSFVLAASSLEKWGELGPKRIAQLLLVTRDIRQLISYGRDEPELRAFVGGRHLRSAALLGYWRWWGNG